VNTSDYNRHMDILQDINLRVVEMFEQQGIAFAYPVQRLYLEQEPAVQTQLIGEKPDQAQHSA
jgi:small-conductance mechanosensitive channel